MELLGLIQNDSPVRSNWANHSGIRFSRACTPQPWVSAVLWAGSLPWPLVGRWGGGCSRKSLPRPPHVMRQSGLFFFFSIGSFLFFGDWTTAGRGQWAFLGSAWLLLISKEWHAGGEVPGPRAAGPGRRAAGRKAAQGTRPQPLSPVGPHSTA